MANQDTTRFLNQPLKQYRGARLQQGRSLLDADHDEGARPVEDARQQLLVDALGAVAHPDAGFSAGQALPLTNNIPAQAQALGNGDILPVQQIRLNGVPTYVHAVSIRAGSVYLGGHRYDLGRPEHIFFQRDYLQLRHEDVPALDPIGGPGSPSPDSPDSPGSPHLHFPAFRNYYFLNAWEQCVTAVEDGELQEKGLAGPDTSVRVRRMRRVECRHVAANITTCGQGFDEVIRSLEAENGSFDRRTNELKSLGRLQLVFQQPDTSTECGPCNPDPPAQYLGAENQALRLMLSAANKFVWTNDNSAPLYCVMVTGLSGNGNGVVVTMLTPPKDVEHQPRANQVVEIIPFAAVLEQAEGLSKNPHFQKVAAEVGKFVRAQTGYDADKKQFTLEPGTRTDAIRDQLVWQWDSRHPASDALKGPASGDGRFFFMRVWHQADDPNDVELPTRNDPVGAPLGSTGIIPVFHHDGRVGDSWTATVRVDARDRIVPFDLLSEPGGVPPHGPRHFYAPLALIQGEDEQVDAVDGCQARGKSSERACATRTVGDGVHSVGDYLSIQQAIDSLPAEGGVVEVRPGRYQETVLIQQRANITVRGCGLSSVVVTPESSSAPALIDLNQTQSITIADLKLEAAGMPGVRARTSSEVSLRSMTAQAGSLTSGVFVPGGGSSTAALIDLSDDVGVDLGELRLEGGRQRALLATNVTRLVLRGGVAQGSPSTTNAPQPELLSFNQSSELTLSRCGIAAFGQVGLFLNGCHDVALRDLAFDAAPYTGVSPIATRTALDVNACEKVRVLRSQVAFDASATPSAAVSLHGDSIQFEDNLIETFADAGTFRAWGGVHVRGASRRVTLRRNRVSGGLGHGFTLGSVLFGANGSPPFTRREGPGRGQIDTTGPKPAVTGSLIAGFTEGAIHWVPRDEGVIEDVVLTENTVVGMGTCAISALTVLGLGDELIELERAVIARNTLTGNLVQIADKVPLSDSLSPSSPVANAFPFSTSTEVSPLLLRVLSFAGITLGAATESLDLLSNTITGNAVGFTLPVCGIFVLVGDSIVVSDNRVADNGATSSSELTEGVRAGIAVMMAGTGTQSSVSGVGDVLDHTYRPDSAGVALRVANNSVRQPEGRALHVLAAGPMHIENNFLSSRGHHDFGPSSPSPEGNPLLGDVVFVENLGAPWESDQFGPGTLSGYIAPELADEYLSDPPLAPVGPRVFVSLGGAVQFQNNQVVYDWAIQQLPPDPPLCTFPVTIVSVDHVSLSGNQFGLRLSGLVPPNFGTAGGVTINAPVLSQVYVGGATVDCVRNRFSEHPGSTYFSLVSFAQLMNTTAYNQSSHIVLAHTASPDLSPPEERPYVIDKGNQVVFRRNSPSQSSLNGNAALQSFLKQYLAVLGA